MDNNENKKVFDNIMHKLIVFTVASMILIFVVFLFSDGFVTIKHIAGVIAFNLLLYGVYYLKQKEWF